MSLYPILDTGLFRRHELRLRDAVELALSFPLPYIQIRHKGEFDRAMLAQIEECAGLPHQGRLILNDRADYAKLFGLGLHIGQEDLSPREARKILGPDLALGYSTHNLAQLQAAPFSELSYVALGPIYGTASKLNPDPTVGLENLKAWRAAAPIPLVAIGGITRENAAATLAAGADLLSVISALWPAPFRLEAFAGSVREWLRLEREAGL